MANDIRKLPRWAQERIKILQLQVDALERERAQLLGEAETNTKFRTMHGYQPLPNDAHIKFEIDNDGLFYIDAWLAREKGKTYLEVIGGYVLQIVPRAGNAIRIYVPRD